MTYIHLRLVNLDYNFKKNVQCLTAQKQLFVNLNKKFLNLLLLNMYAIASLVCR